MQPEETRTILITGCSSGIGYTCAHGLQERGYRVFASARKPEDVERLSGEGLEALRLDLEDSAGIRDAVDQVRSWPAPKAGSTLCSTTVPTRKWGPWKICRARCCAPSWRPICSAGMSRPVVSYPSCTTRAHGRIVQNSSILGLAALAYRGAYVAGKFALEGLTDTLRLELAGSGIQVSLIEPSPIESRIQANSIAPWKDACSRKDRSNPLPCPPGGAR